MCYILEITLITNNIMMNKKESAFKEFTVKLERQATK